MSSPTKPIAMLLIALTLTTSMAGQEKVISDAELNELMLDTLPSGVVKLKSFKEIRTALKTKKNVAFFDKITAIALSYEEYETAMKLGASMYPFIDKTRQEVDRAVALLEKLKQFKSKVDNSMVLGDMDAYAGFLLVYYDLEKSQAYFTKAIATFQPVSDEETFALARVYLYRAKTQKFMGNYAEATQDYITSADYFHQVRSKKSGAQRLYFQALSENASIYTDLGMPVLAKGQLIRVVEEKNKSGFTGEIAQDYYLLSMAYGDLKQHGLQRKALVQASQNTRSDDPAIAVAIYAELCNYSIDEKQFKLAKKYLDTLENIVKTNDFTTQRNKLFLQTKANYLASVKQYDEASSILGGLLKESSASNNVQGTMAVHDFSYLINKWNGNYKKALYHFEAKSALLDSSANKKNKQLFQYYQTQFETEKKEKDILAKQFSIDKLSAENKAQTRMLTFGGVSAFLLFGWVLLYRQQRQIAKEQRLQQQFSQQLLITQEEERKRISKDLHDSLGQTLLLMKHSIIQKKSEQNEQLVNAAIEEMRTISRVLHPFQLEEVGLQKSIENLIQQLDENYDDTYIFGDIDNVDEDLTTAQKLNIFRIVQECLSNVIKHAQASSSKVDLIRKVDKIHLTIKDNGTGFDYREQYQNFKTLGLKTIHERVNYLKGTLNIDTAPNKGTTYSIAFPAV